MVPLQVANDTRSVARKGTGVSLHRMEVQMKRVRYLAEKSPWFSPPSVSFRENATCRYIRDHLFPLLDEGQKEMVIAGKGHYKLAMGKVDDADGLYVRIGLLDSLLERMRTIGGGKLDGEAAHAWKILMSEAEALVLKKRGTAALRLFVEGSRNECICMSEKSLQAAVDRWRQLGSNGKDHAKALYWLALAKYGMRKLLNAQGNAWESAGKTMGFCGWKATQRTCLRAP